MNNALNLSKSRITPAYELRGSTKKFHKMTYNNYSVYAFKKLNKLV